MARDARFDGLFFVAVKTTGVFCRPICTAVAPKEKNVEYYTHSIQAAQAGYRPCLRCRPDSAPDSFAWRGTDTTVGRALQLIDEGALSLGSMESLAERLGVSSRYLRKLFVESVGTAPKTYALFKQVMFAKKLLHETALPVSAVAEAAGFNSVRRFNDAFQKQINMTPSAIRRHSKASSPSLKLSLAYRPPLDWKAMLDFWQARAIDQLEWVNGDCYGRSYQLPVRFEKQTQSGEQRSSMQLATGWFEVAPCEDKHAFTVSIAIDHPACLRAVVQHIRRILDLDTDIETVERHLKKEKALKPLLATGIRIPGIWHPFEAGVRAIVGQQVSVAAARTHVQRLVAELGAKVAGQSGLRFFPTPAAVARDSLDVLKMPAKRRQTVRDFAHWFDRCGEQADVDQWLTIKGIGPWTVQYVRLRALGDPDIWLAGDLGLKKALAEMSGQHSFNNDNVKPWSSYATFQLWRSLS